MHNVHVLPIACRHGGGFSLTLTFSSLEGIAGGVEFLRNRFPGMRDLKQLGRTVSFHVPDERVSAILGQIFTNKGRIGLAEFVFKETSLDDVFIKFASTTEETTANVESAPMGEGSD